MDILRKELHQSCALNEWGRLISYADFLGLNGGNGMLDFLHNNRMEEIKMAFVDSRLVVSLFIFTVSLGAAYGTLQPLGYD